MSIASLIPAELSDEALVKTSEVAAWLRVSVTTVNTWAKSGRLPKPLELGPCTRKFRVGELREALCKLDGKANEGSKK